MTTPDLLPLMLANPADVGTVAGMVAGLVVLFAQMVTQAFRRTT